MFFLAFRAVAVAISTACCLKCESVLHLSVLLIFVLPSNFVVFTKLSSEYNRLSELCLFTAFNGFARTVSIMRV